MYAATCSGEMSRSPSPRAAHHPRDCPTARPYAARVLAFAIAGAALSWPRRAGGDVSILAAAAGSHRRSGSSGGRASAVAPETRTPPPKPRTGPRPPSSSPTCREGRCRPGRGDPVGARLAGGLGQLGVALPLSPPGAAPLAPGGEPTPAAAVSRSGEVSASGAASDLLGLRSRGRTPWRTRREPGPDPPGPGPSGAPRAATVAEASAPLSGVPPPAPSATPT